VYESIVEIIFKKNILLGNILKYFFYFLKFILNISTLKRSKNTKNLILKKNSNFKEMKGQLQYQTESISDETLKSNILVE
jgi:hypothetical protein